VKYVQVAPPPAAVTPPVVEPVLPPLQPAVEPPKPVVPEPVIPQVELPKLATADPKAEVKVESPIIGTGGGTGNDGTKGNGPGTGGGVGSGVGTGRGSGVGPGTGGGVGDTYIPTLIEMPIPPQPVPEKINGSKVIVNFDIDAQGKILGIEFTPTRDGGYNRKLNDLFKTFRFRPAVTHDGVPIRAKYQMEIIL
jgi:protein TonB